MSHRVDRAAKEQALALPPAHGATVSFIVERLRDDILAGRAPAGWRLVEWELTSRFAVSRGPVREALRRLAAEGLVEHQPHRGALVRRLSARDIRELFQVRVEMELLAARLAAEADDRERRAQFTEAIRPILDDAARSVPEYLAENATFHEAVMTLAGNLQLRDLAMRLNLPLIMAQVGDILTPDVLRASVREHRAVAKAIAERNPDAAAASMRAHLERAAIIALERRAAAEADEKGKVSTGLRARATH